MPVPEGPNSKASGRRASLVFARLLQRWHRSAGVAAALFLVFIGVTGVMLMHSDRLGLPASQIGNRRLLDWYGIRPPPPPRGFECDGHWFSQSGERVFFDTREVPLTTGVLLGAFATGPGGGAREWLLVTDLQAVVIDDSGAVLERFGRDSGFPAGLTAAGRDAAGGVILASTAERFRFDPTTGEFVTAGKSDPVDWSNAGTPPSAVATVIARQYSGEGVSVERVLLDLHSGRLFGTVGIVVVNLAALLLVFLAATGLYLWSRRARGRTMG